MANELKETSYSRPRVTCGRVLRKEYVNKHLTTVTPLICNGVAYLEPSFDLRYSQGTCNNCKQLIVRRVSE